MDVSGVSTGQASSALDRTSLGRDFDQFLRLLTTQLQNQDPLAPMESTEFTNQLVQFSSVEQAIKTNTNLENLLAMQTLNMTALGVSFIGKEVEVDGKKFETSGGQAKTMAYSLPSAATSGTVTILDANGNTVHSRAAELSAGRHEFTWDGKDQDGNPVPAGTYELRVGALTGTNGSLNVQTFVPGYVSALESGEDGNLLLNIGDRKVPLTDVRKISIAAPVI